MTQQFPPPPSCPGGFLYTVQRGDTLFLLAQRFGVSLSALIQANPQLADPNLIFPGQVLCIPTAPDGIPTIECCMLLFRTANVPVDPDAEAAGVARIFQTAAGGNVLVSAIGLPDPAVLGGTTYVAWIRQTPTGQTIPIQLFQTGPVVVEPGVWVGAFIFGAGEQIAPFQDIVVTAELSPPFVQPNLARIALICRFDQCRPQ